MGFRRRLPKGKPRASGTGFAILASAIDRAARTEMHIGDLRPDRRHAHFVFGVLQSGLTSFIASGFGSLPLVGSDMFWASWLKAWGLSWLVMLPLVLVAAPFIRKAATLLTRERGPSASH